MCSVFKGTICRYGFGIWFDATKLYATAVNRPVASLLQDNISVGCSVVRPAMAS